MKLYGINTNKLECFCEEPWYILAMTLNLRLE